MIYLNIRRNCFFFFSFSQECITVGVGIVFGRQKETLPFKAFRNYYTKLLSLYVVVFISSLAIKTEPNPGANY